MSEYYSCNMNFLWIKIGDDYRCLQDWNRATWGTTSFTYEKNRWTKIMNWDAILNRYDYPEAKNKVLSIKSELEKREFYKDVLDD